MVIFLTANTTQNKMFTIRLRLFYKVEESVTSICGYGVLVMANQNCRYFVTLGLE